MGKDQLNTFIRFYHLSLYKNVKTSKKKMFIYFEKFMGWPMNFSIYFFGFYLGLNTLLPPKISTLYFFLLKVSFLSHKVTVVFIKTKMILLLKFRPKLNENATSTPIKCFYVSHN
jgi:hypothetical protein